MPYRWVMRGAHPLRWDAVALTRPLLADEVSQLVPNSALCQRVGLRVHSCHTIVTTGVIRPASRRDIARRFAQVNGSVQT